MLRASLFLIGEVHVLQYMQRAGRNGRHYRKRKGPSSYYYGAMAPGASARSRAHDRRLPASARKKRRREAASRGNAARKQHHMRFCARSPEHVPGALVLAHAVKAFRELVPSVGPREDRKQQGTFCCMQSLARRSHAQRVCSAIHLQGRFCTLQLRLGSGGQDVDPWCRIQGHLLKRMLAKVRRRA